MKRIKMNRRDFIKNGAFITGSAAGASLMVGVNPELEAATSEADTATRTTALGSVPLLRGRLRYSNPGRERQNCLHAPGQGPSH